MKRKSVFVSLAAVLAVAGCVSGEGLDATLNASNGYDVNYHASLSKAFLKMTPTQQEAYNWAVGDLLQQNFIAMYGTTPTVRKVIEGEIRRYEKQSDEQIAKQKERMAAVEGEIAENEELRRKAKEVLDTIAVSAKYVVGKPEKQKCEGLACVDEKLEAPMVEYVVSNPRKLDLAKYPCHAEIVAPNSDKKEKIDLDGCDKEGTFRKEIKRTIPFPLESAEIKVVLDQSEARLKNYSKAIPHRHPAVVDMKYLQLQREEIAKYRKALSE